MFLVPQFAGQTTEPASLIPVGSGESRWSNQSAKSGDGVAVASLLPKFLMLTNESSLYVDSLEVVEDQAQFAARAASLSEHLATLGATAELQTFVQLVEDQKRFLTHTYRQKVESGLILPSLKVWASQQLDSREYLKQGEYLARQAHYLALAHHANVPLETRKSVLSSPL